MNSAPVFDRSTAVRHVGDDDRTLRELAELFVEWSDSFFGDIRAAHAAEDAVALRKAVHRYRSGVSNFFAGEVEAALDQVARAVGSEDGTETEAGIRELEAATDRLVAALREYLSTPSRRSE